MVLRITIWLVGSKNKQTKLGGEGERRGGRFF